MLPVGSKFECYAPVFVPLHVYHITKTTSDLSSFAGVLRFGFPLLHVAGYAPTGTAEDRDKLAAARADWCTLATSTRVVSIRALSTGVWRPDVSGAPGAGVVELTVMRGAFTVARQVTVSHSGAIVPLMCSLWLGFPFSLGMCT